MDVYGIQISDKSLSNFDLMKYAEDLNIPNFRGVFMRDELPKIPWLQECGIVNFNTSSEPGSHCYVMLCYVAGIWRILNHPPDPS